jgi:hypothetical protein
VFLADDEVLTRADSAGMKIGAALTSLKDHINACSSYYHGCDS